MFSKRNLGLAGACLLLLVLQTPIAAAGDPHSHYGEMTDLVT